MGYTTNKREAQPKIEYVIQEVQRLADYHIDEYDWASVFDSHNEGDKIHDLLEDVVVRLKRLYYEVVKQPEESENHRKARELREQADRLVAQAKELEQSL